jgi:IS30 family transposase
MADTVERFYTVEEVAGHLNRSEPTIYRLVKRGNIKVRKAYCSTIIEELCPACIAAIRNSQRGEPANTKHHETCTFTTGGASGL